MSPVGAFYEGESCMPKVARHAVCNETDIIELRSIADGDDYSEKVRRRARCVLRSAEGQMHKDIAAETGMSPNWVSRWVDRYNEEGVAGLMDRPRSGRRGGPAMADVASQVKGRMGGDPPGDGRWTADAVADGLGVGVGTVRDAARSSGITFERRREWEFETDDELSARGTDVVGLFVSGSERAVVVSSLEGGEAPTGSGSFATRNSALARDLARASESGPVGLAGALSLAAAHAADGGRFSQSRRLDGWLDGVVSGLPCVPGATHTVVLMSELPSARRLLRHPGICFVRIEGESEWEAAACSHLGVGSGGGEASSRLREALSAYLSSRVDGCETFAWSKRADPSAAAGRPAPVRTDANDDGSDDGDAGSGPAAVGDTVGNADGGGAKAKITIEYVGSSGGTSSATVEVGGLMDPADCDPSSSESVLAFVADLERRVIPAVDRAGQLIGRAALSAATKKNYLGRG